MRVGYKQEQSKQASPTGQKTLKGSAELKEKEICALK